MNDRDYLPVTPCLCINLRRIAQKVTGFYDDALKPVGVTVNQYSLLANLARMEGCGTGELAQQVRLEKSTLVRTLQPLLRGGLMADLSAPESRQRQFVLTPAGEDVLKKAFPLWRRAQEDMAAKMGKTQEDIVRILSDLDKLD